MKLTKEEFKDLVREILKEELFGRKSDTKLKEDTTTSWDDLVAQADELLEELIIRTGNDSYDDGDGYWAEEHTNWCNRYLYYSNTLNNTDRLETMCNEYSNKIPGVSFYFVEDDTEEDPVSEIGYNLVKSSSVTEAAFSGGVAGDSSFSGGTVRGLGASTQPDKKSYLNRLKSKNPDLVDTTTVKGKDIKPGMITQAGQVKTVEVKKNNRGEEKVYIMHTNNYDGFWDTEEDMLVMLDPDDKSKPFTGDYKELLKKGLKESK